MGSKDGKEKEPFCFCKYDPDVKCFSCSHIFDRAESGYLLDYDYPCSYACQGCYKKLINLPDYNCQTCNRAFVCEEDFIFHIQRMSKNHSLKNW